jgi:hypothetical protein
LLPWHTFADETVFYGFYASFIGGSDVIDDVIIIFGAARG